MRSLTRVVALLQDVGSETSRPNVSFVVVYLFTVPPALLWLASVVAIPVSVARLSVVIAPVTTLGYYLWISGRVSDDEPESRVTTAPSVVSAADARLEYEEVSEEVRYHHQLAVRSSYFSLATLALLGNLVYQIGVSVFLPFVAELGMFVAFGFLVTAEKHITWRDALRTRQEALEGVDGPSILRTRSARPNGSRYPAIDLGVHIVDFHRFTLHVWIAAYHITTVYVAFVILG